MTARAGGHIFGSDRSGFNSNVTYVESQVGLSFVFILPVTIETVFREDGTNISVELQRFGGVEPKRQSHGYQTDNA